MQIILYCNIKPSFSIWNHNEIIFESIYLKRIENIYHYHWKDFLSLFVFIELGESMNDLPRDRFISWHLIKLLPCINSSKSVLYLERSDLKCSCISLSALSLIMISMSSLFECIKHSSSVHFRRNIYIISIVNWIFHVTEFLRLFMMYFMYGLISSSIFYVFKRLKLIYVLKKLFKNF